MAMAAGRKTGGRTKGTPNKRSAARQKSLEEMRKILSDKIPNSFKGDAHTFLVAVYVDQDLPLQLRIDAAKAAIGYEKPKLANIRHQGDPENPLAHAILTAVPRADVDDDRRPEISAH
jgi:hypothetical protein